MIISLSVLVLMLCLAGIAPLRYRQLKMAAPLYWLLSVGGQLMVLPLTVLALVLAVASHDSRVFPLAILAGLAGLAGIVRQWRVRQQAIKTAERLGLGGAKDFAVGPMDVARWLGVFFCRRRGLVIKRDVAYGQFVAQKMDIYRDDRPGETRPVLIHIHGGAWVTGKKGQMGRPLIHDMAQRGWLVCDIEYRLGPEHRYPAMVVDVLCAIAWIKANAGRYGGNGEFVAVTGGSAGGHLTALSTLLPEALRRDYAAGASTDVQAVAPCYGRYDFLDRFDIINDPTIANFTRDKVMPGAVEDVGEAIWREASPIDQVGPHLPACLLVHGGGDCMIDRDEARVFAEAQAAVAANDFEFFLAPGVQHAFDLGHCIQADAINRLIQLFLNRCHARFSESRLQEFSAAGDRESIAP